MRLGVNIDHVATLRQARGTDYPDPVEAAVLAHRAGAASITAHLREDRRHIQEHDVTRLLASLGCGLNLEMAVTPEMLALARAWHPMACCLVPEKREELTTEGGLDVVANQARIADACRQLVGDGIRVSLFVDPVMEQIVAARDAGASAVELHTGDYANSTGAVQAAELERLVRGADEAAQQGLEVHAGHGLTVENVAAVAAIEPLVELNIGHSIVGRSVLIGIEAAVREMSAAIARGRVA